VITLQEIQRAQATIAPYAKHTPLVRSEFLSDLCHANINLKLDNLQVTHSFKVRGV